MSEVVVADVVAAVIAVEELLYGGSPFAEEALDHVTIFEFKLLVAGPAAEALCVVEDAFRFYQAPFPEGVLTLPALTLHRHIKYLIIHHPMPLFHAFIYPLSQSLPRPALPQNKIDTITFCLPAGPGRCGPSPAPPLLILPSCLPPNSRKEPFQPLSGRQRGWESLSTASSRRDCSRSLPSRSCFSPGFRAAWLETRPEQNGCPW